MTVESKQCPLPARSPELGYAQATFAAFRRLLRRWRPRLEVPERGAEKWVECSRSDYLLLRHRFLRGQFCWVPTGCGQTYVCGRCAKIAAALREKKIADLVRSLGNGGWFVTLTVPAPQAGTVDAPELQRRLLLESLAAYKRRCLREAPYLAVTESTKPDGGHQHAHVLLRPLGVERYWGYHRGVWGRVVERAWRRVARAPYPYWREHRRFKVAVPDAQIDFLEAFGPVRARARYLAKYLSKVPDSQASSEQAGSFAAVWYWRRRLTTSWGLSARNATVEWERVGQVEQERVAAVIAPSPDAVTVFYV